MNINKKYKQLVEKVYNEGFMYEDPNRKGVIRKQLSFYQFKHEFKDGYPIIGLKQCYPKMAFNEMLSFMRGYTNLKDLESLGVTFWRDDAFNYFKRKFPYSEVTIGEYLEGSLKGTWNDGPHFEWGDLGKIYSHHIRNWNGEVDQLNQVLERLKSNLNNTKNVVTMWNPSDMEDCALSPCHRDFEFITEELTLEERYNIFCETNIKDFKYYYNNVKESEKEEYFNKLGIPSKSLTIQWNQSSVDTFLGLPVNIMYYSDVCYVFAHYLGLYPKGIVGNLSNVHLYDNSFKAVEELLNRNIIEVDYPVKLELNLPKSWTSLDDYLNQLSYGKSFKVLNYSHLGRLDVKMLAYSK